MFDTLIGAQALRAKRSEPGCVIVDSRYELADRGAGYRAYLAGHIPGAVYAHLHDDLSGPPLTDHGRHPIPSPSRLRELFCSFGISAGVQVVTYDDSSGAIAARLWWMLRYMGHDAAAVLNGGWSAWVDAGFETEQRETRNLPSPFLGSPRDDWLVTLAQVSAAPLLLDAREPARYRGEKESIDPVAGHIPGARNYFWKENIDARGAFRPKAEIRRRMESVYGSCPAGDVVCYCGSGVTACVNILAAVHAGLPFPRLYAGSWSEWCADPARPIATGEG
ncbi:MAG: sulfurtransferase [Gammaproteobacteria bacterium]|nr:sulfurtransferase [Gammaproteobacteria bacterium]